MAHKYNKLINFEIEVGNIFIINSFKVYKGKKMLINMNLLSFEGLNFVHRLTDKEKEICRMTKGLFEVLSEKFKHHQNEMMVSFPYCDLIGEEDKSAEEWWVVQETKKMNVNTENRADD